MIPSIIIKKMKNTYELKPLDPSKIMKPFPQCLNKKQARMVCLNEGCEDYAFFCLQCDDESCESIHRHVNKADKYEAISFKQFVRRVLRDRKPIESLQSAINTYRQTLQRLRSDINEFVERQLNSIIDIIRKVSELPPDLAENIKKLKEQHYMGLKGKEMDYLWKNSGDAQEIHKMQVETADYIRVKEEQLKAISEHFQNLNKMQIEKIEEYERGNSNRNTIELKNPSKGAKTPPLMPPSSSLSNGSNSKKSKLF